MILLALLTPNILRSPPGTCLTGDSPLVHHGAELSVAQLVVLVPVVLLEGGLHLVLTHSPASPNGSGDHFVLTDVAVGVDIKSLGDRDVYCCVMFLLSYLKCNFCFCFSVAKFVVTDSAISVFILFDMMIS